MGDEGDAWRLPVWAGDELGVVAAHLLAWAEVARMAGEDECNPEAVGMLIHDGLRAEREAVMRVASGREPDEG